jgi:hypothetical protein
MVKVCGTHENGAVRIYAQTRRAKRLPGGHFQLIEETSKARMRGYGFGEQIRLTDDNGVAWFGSASYNEDSTIGYRFRDAQGRSLSGIGDGSMLTLRDDAGATWKGAVS